MMPPAPRALTRADWTKAALVAAGLLAVYALTTPRSVAFEDDGLFILAANFLGIAHPPGYPLFVLIGKLFTFVPVGSIAYRVHLVSAFFGGLSCALLWLCVRSLLESRPAACLAAVGLGLSPVFWSQSIIAEVYTINTFFFLLLTLLALRGASLAWMAFLFGLSLTDHWPLMGLVAPGFVALLWPRRMEFLRRLPLLTVVFLLGLTPYAWMVVRSWQWLPISFYGPLETFHDFWYTVTRAGYANTDQSISASGLDRIRFFEFVGTQVLMQFALLGTLLAAVGFAQQRRMLGRGMAIFLTIVFLTPTFGLLLLLRFDYDSVTKHIFHVYPLPAYAAAAIWMALGFSWLENRNAAWRRHAAAATAALLVLIAAVGSRSNLLWDYDWEARYAKTVLSMVPKDGVLFVRGDIDLAPIAYLYLVEGWRPDIELYHSTGRVLGNRLMYGLRMSQKEIDAVLRKFIETKDVPIEFTWERYAGYAHRDHWLTVEVDKSSRVPHKSAIEIPEEAVRFFEESVLSPHERNSWVAFHQDELRRRYASLLMQQLRQGKVLDARTARDLALLLDDFFGALGVAEGLMVSGHAYAPAQVADALERAARLMPSDATKAHRSTYFYLRGALRLDQGDKEGAVLDFQTSLNVWPAPDNPAIRPLKDMYRAAGDTKSLQALDERLPVRQP